ncbi:MAG: AMP-binding protein [Rhodospirillales bacterium]|nr:AMP-binding protein [Rhodospirillales bacterium]
MSETFGQLPPSWQAVLGDELDKPYFQKLRKFVDGEYAKHQVFPPAEDVFAAFEHTPFDQVRVLLLGQDPYHDDGQAHGLCFSVRKGVALPPSLRLVIVGGEAVDPECYTTWRRLAPDVAWLNTYGPTEATVIASFYAPADGESFATSGVPIGRPIANTQFYILDAQLRPTPIGVPGELYIGGLGVARGYLHRPELTVERFLPNPFVDDRRPTTDNRPLTTDDERRTTDNRQFFDDAQDMPPIANRQSLMLYRTGDYARYRPDGAVEFLGRADDQVKIRGFRVELGEIEATLLAHPAVSAAAVVAREDLPGVKRLVAYVTRTEDEGRGTNDGENARPGDRETARPGDRETWAPPTMDDGRQTTDDGPTTTDLRAFLAQRLPEHMLPAVIVRLGALPLTANGKIDRRKLRRRAVNDLSLPTHMSRRARRRKRYWRQSGHRPLALIKSASTTTSSTWAATQF